MSITIGILALQGDFKEHMVSVERLSGKVQLVKNRADLKAVDALIMPGGESTAIAKLLLSTGLDVAIRDRIQEGMPVWGTCAGAILLAKHVSSTVPLDTHIGSMNIDIQRNAYGRQTESFVTTLDVPEGRQEAFFIRAPQVTRVGRGVKVLSTYKDQPVLLQQQHILVSTFHSELSENDLVLRYFLAL